MAATQAALDALQAVSASAKSGVGGAAAASALLQLSAKGRKTGCSKCQKESEKLMFLSAKLHSAALVEVATELTQRSSAKYSPDGFEPVKELLRQLITRLEEEQSAE